MHESGELYHSDAADCEIYRRVFVPQSGEAGGGIVMAHGLGDHLGCHLLAAELFCGHGRMAAGIDWPGHGFSEGRRGHIDGVDTAIHLIAETCRFLRARLGPDAPLGFYAHSTGALFALHYFEMNQQGRFGDPTLFDRIWLGSPLLRPDHGHHPLKQLGAGLVGRIFPRLLLDTGVRPEKCRHVDRETAKANGDYDLCHHRVSAGLASELLRYGKRNAAAAGILDDPTRILITQGGEDGICPPEYSRTFFDRIPAREKTYALLPDLFHEPLREPNNGALIQAVDDWLDRKQPAEG